MAANSVSGEETIATAGSRRGGRLLAFAYLFVLVSLVLAVVAIVVLGNPQAGEAVVRLTLAEPAHELVPAPIHSVTPQIPTTPPDVAPPSGTVAPPPVAPQTVPPPLTAPDIVPPVRTGAALVADPRLIEKTQDGPLPRIADDGTTPMRAYAAPVAVNGRPRIAIVISGMGISAKATAAALERLPPQVTLAFAPYASDVQGWVTKARQSGHEVLLEVPMEPFDFPDSDAGSHTLRAGVGEDSNTQQLVWALTRFTGYTGVTNLLGSRFMSDPESLEPILTYLARRGLLFFDSGAATHLAAPNAAPDVAPDIAARSGVAFAHATARIDAIQAASEIDQVLSRLETESRMNGSASGYAVFAPVTVERVTQWARGLSGRGFVLVPASAIVSTKK